MTNRSVTKNIQKSSKHAARLNRVRALSRLLDNALPIPGTSYRIGLDPILGLFPAIGDYLTTALSAYIVIEAALLGASKATLWRMTLNIIIDTFAGIVPVLGDLFDVTWKANSANLALLEAHMESPLTSKKANWWFIAMLLGVVILVLVAVTTVSWWILSSLFKFIFG